MKLLKSKKYHYKKRNKDILIDKLEYKDNMFFIKDRDIQAIKSISLLFEKGFYIYRSTNDNFTSKDQRTLKQVFNVCKEDSINYLFVNDDEMYNPKMVTDDRNKKIWYAVSNKAWGYDGYNVDDSFYDFHNDYDKFEDLLNNYEKNYNESVNDYWRLIEYLKEEYNAKITNTEKKDGYHEVDILLKGDYPFIIKVQQASAADEKITMFYNFNFSVPRTYDIFDFKIGKFAPKKDIKAEIDRNIKRYDNYVSNLKNRLTMSESDGTYKSLGELEDLESIINKTFYKEVINHIYKHAEYKVSIKEPWFYFQVEKYLEDWHRKRIDSILVEKALDDDDFYTQYFNKFSNRVKVKISDEQDKNKDIDFF